VEHWLRGKERRATLFGQFGSNVRDYVAMDGSNRVATTADINDMDRVARAFARQPTAGGGSRARKPWRDPAHRGVCRGMSGNTRQQTS
jgi:hypothetical protein